MPATVTIVINGEDKTQDARESVTQGLASIGEASDTAGLSVGVFLGEMAAKLVEVAASEAWGAIKDGFNEIVAGGMASNEQFETFDAKFQVMFKDAGMAKDRMEELQKVGFTNPEQLADIDKMDLKLTNVGLDSENTAKKWGLSGETIRQDILNTATGVATGAGDMGEKLARVTNDITKFSQATGAGSTQAVNDLVRMGAVTREELGAMGIHWNAHNAIIGDKVENTKALLDALGNKYKGLNEISMSSMAGLKSNFEDVKQYVERILTSSMFDAFKAGYADVVAILTSPEAKQAFEDINTGVGKIMNSFQLFAGDVSSNKGFLISAFEGIATALNFIGDAANYLGNNWANIKDTFFTPISSLAANMEVWGNNVVVSFANGMQQGISAVAGAVGSIGAFITDALESHSPPNLLRGLTTWGQGAVNSYMDGWKMADYTAFDGIKKEVQSRIEQMMPEKSDKRGALVAILGTDDAVSKALGEFEKTGQVAASTYDLIREKAGSASGKIVDFVKAEVDSLKAQKEDAEAAKEVADAKAKIAEITQRYKDILDPLDDKMKIIAARTNELKDATAASTQPDRDRLQNLQDQAEAYKKLADEGINKLKDKLGDLNDAEQKIKDGVDGATQALRDHLEAVQSDAAEYKSLTDIDINGFKDQIAALTQAQSDLNDKMADQIAPIQGQIDIINNQEKQIANAKALKDANDLANGTGSHRFDLEKAKLAVQKDATDSQMEAMRYQSEMEKTEASINSGKLKGAALDEAKIHLQELQVAHQQKLIDLQLKAEEDKQKLSDVGSGGGAAQVKAQSEAKKLALEEQVHAIKDSHQAESAAIKDKEEAVKKELKDAEAVQKAKLASYKDDEDATKAKIKGIEEAAKAQEKAITLQKHALEEEIKGQEKAEKTKLDSYKAEEDATKDTIKQKEDASKQELQSLHQQELSLKAQETVIKNKQEVELKGAGEVLKKAEDHKKVADEHLKVAQDHLKVMEAQTKEADDQLKKKQEIDKLDDAAAKRSAGGAGHHGGGIGKIGPIDNKIDPTGGDGPGKQQKKDDPAADQAHIDHLVALTKPFNDFMLKVQEVKKQVEEFVTTVNQKWDDFKAKTTEVFDIVVKALKPEINATVVAFEKMKPTLDEIGTRLDHFGAVIGPKLQPLLTALGHVLKDVAEILGGIVVAAFGLVVGAVEGLLKAFDNALPWIEKLVSGMVDTFTAEMQFLSDLFDGLGNIVDDVVHKRWAFAWGDAKRMFQNLADDVKHIVMGLSEVVVGYFGTLVSGAEGLLEGFCTGAYNFFYSLYENLVGHSIVPDTVNAVIKWFAKLVTDVIAAITGFVTDMEDKFNSIKDKITKAISDAITTIKTNIDTFTTDVLGKIVQLGVDIYTKAEDVGHQIINGITDGVTNFAHKLTDSVKGAVGGAVQGAKDYLGIKSPSTVFKEEVGHWIPAGLASGIDGNIGAVDEAMKRLGTAAAPQNVAQLAAPKSEVQSFGSIGAQVAQIQALAQQLPSGGGGTTQNISFSPVFNFPITVSGGDMSGIQNAAQNATTQAVDNLKSAMALLKGAP